MINTLKCVFRNKSVLAHTDSLSDMAQPCDTDLTISLDQFIHGSESGVIF